eukprot:307191_1
MTPTDLIVLIVSVSVYSTIYIPLLIYYGWKYYQNRNHVALKQRYASITIMEIIWTLMNTIAINVMQFYFLYNYKHFVLTTKDHNLIYLTCAVPAAIGLSCCWIWRFWMIKFDMKFAIATSNNQWIYIIDPNAMQLAQSRWYLTHKNTFGNIRWCGYHVIVPCILFWIIFTAFSVYATLTEWTATLKIIYLSDSITAFLLWIILFAVYFTFPRFHDFFYISDELKRLIFVYIAIVINDGYNFYRNVKHFKTTMTSGAANGLINWSCFTTISMISTWWVLKKLQSINIVQVARRTKADVNRKMSVALINAKSLEIDSINATQLKQVLSNDEFFHIYIQYLAKELSVHFLLAFMEIIQLQHFILELNEIDINEKFSGTLCNNIRFYGTCPRSLIVYDEAKYSDDMLINAKQKSNELYRKYIEYGSEYEIILSADTHNKVSEVMSHLDWIDDDEFDFNCILQLWDDVSKELFTLLLKGFSRFQTTIQYKNLDLQCSY